VSDLVDRLRRLADTRRRGHSVHPDVLREAANAIDNLTAERDEARREVCNLMYQRGFPTGDYAKGRGWDCYEEDKPCQ
jgi:hypothetical protein